MVSPGPSVPTPATTEPPPHAFEYTWRWRLDASPGALWPLVADTNRFNRDTRLPPVEAVGDGKALENARRRLRFRLGGMTTQWEEQPFEWVRPRRFGVVRRYERGPLTEMRVRVTLEPVGDGATDLTYHVLARPRGIVGRLAIPLGIGVASRLSFGRVFRRYARAVDPTGRGDAPAPPGRDLAGRPQERARRLTGAGVDETAARALVAHVHEADDPTLARMRPYALASAWGLERRAVLEAFLHGTRQGLVDLRWDVICPLCHGPARSAARLDRLRAGEVHCDTCLVGFETDFDRSVEVSFAPNPAIRRVEAPPFCVAGPRVTPHVEVQQLLAPGERRVVEPLLEPGRHRARTLDGGAASPVTVAGNGAGGGNDGDGRGRGNGATGELAVRVTEAGLSATPGTVAPRVRITLHNESDRERLVLLERLDWGDDAVTAAELTSLQAFRDLFAAETLRSGDVVSVGSLAVLFTDLRDSSGLYGRMGDAAAFARVMDHFTVLRDAVVPEDGAVVKTLGDAVMAVFRSPVAAVRAVLAARAALDRAAAREGHEPLVLKAGIHAGPCIAVTLNERLDYFGSTVNVAARLGELSRGGDLVLSGAVMDDHGVRALARSRGWRAEPLDARLRGMEGDHVPVWRIAPSAGEYGA